MRNLASLALVIVAACAAHTRVSVPPPAGEHIVIVEFAAAGSGHDGAQEGLGLRLASEIADELLHRNLDAEAVPADTTPRGTLVVRGRIVDIDGGSRALRFWIGFGAGAASVTADGTVARVDGTPLASFRDKRSASGAAELGLATDVPLIDKCVHAVARDIAEMIATGQYEHD